MHVEESLSSCDDPKLPKPSKIGLEQLSNATSDFLITCRVKKIACCFFLINIQKNSF